ncbi:MAG: DMT family transporter [Pseudomonadota bacterium]
MRYSAISCALAAAGLFGISTPLAKLLIGAVDPWLLAGLFYLGSGVGLTLLRMALSAQRAKVEAPLTRGDIPWLGGAILFGGVIGPILLMVGLSQTEAATASLLFTLEGVATALIAWFAFRENFDRRIAMGMFLIVAGAMVLSWHGEARLQGLLGPAAIVGACLAWGLDNNLTRRVSLADPVQTAMLKGLVAAPVSLALAFAHGASLPTLATMAAATLVGFFGYGVSLVLFVTALRDLGTARTGAYFSTAPFLGAAAAIPLLGEGLSAQLLLAGALMAAGAWLHLTERHAHEHEHEPIEHEHRHVHDEHHRHAHSPQDPPGEPHSHRHIHTKLRHAHAHLPDSHHRHTH